MSKQIIAGGVAIGGGAPVTIQSMCNTHTEDAKATIAQIHALEEAGCEIVRVTVPNMEAAHALSEIKENISIPLVADIHFDYRLAVEAAARGAGCRCGQNSHQPRQHRGRRPRQGGR